jgi:hypothetical protein
MAGVDGPDREERLVRRAEAALDRLDPRVLLAVAVTGSGALLLILLSHLTFFGDDWDPLLYRRGFNLDVLLRPHAEHILLAPTLIYKGIQATIGMESLVPYAVISTASFLVSAVLLFFYLRRRVGDWLALAALLPVLFMGTAWEVLLWPFEVSFTASMATGTGALLALERDDERGDAVACALLVVSLTFSELAIPFVLGAAVWMILARRSWSRAYVLVVPLVLYAAWYAGWGHTAQSHVSVHNLVHSPKYVLAGLASTAGSLLGVPNKVSIWVGLPLLLLVVVVAVVRFRSTKPLPRSFWSALAILLAFWFLDAINEIPGRGPNASRYQYVGAFLLLMVLAELAGGIRLRRPVLLGALGIASLAVITNLVVLGYYYERMSDWATRARGALAAFQVGGASADPNFVTGPANTDIVSLNSLQVGLYLSAVDAFGSPAYGASELANAPEEARVAADQLLADAEELRLMPVDRPPPPGGPPPRVAGATRRAAAPRGSCLTVPGADDASPPVDLPRPGVTVSGPVGSVEIVELRRFASSFPVRYELRGVGVLLIRTDRSPRPWQLRVSGPGPTRICGIG